MLQALPTEWRCSGLSTGLATSDPPTPESRSGSPRDRSQATICHSLGRVLHATGLGNHQQVVQRSRGRRNLGVSSQLRSAWPLFPWPLSPLAWPRAYNLTAKAEHLTALTASVSFCCRSNALWRTSFQTSAPTFFSSSRWASQAQDGPANTVRNQGLRAFKSQMT